MTSCLEVRRLTPRLVALDLPPESEAAVRDHLRACAACRDLVAARAPALALALRMNAGGGPEDDRFVGEVLAGVHQRSIERRLSRRRSRIVASAAAIAALMLGGTTVVSHLERRAPRPVAAAARAQAPVVEPAFVEVDEAGVRLYQLTPTSQSREAIQVAFIVDPHLEL